MLIRHAEAEGNFQRRFQGHYDAAISEKGKRQLDLLALRCRNMERSVIYSSPLLRAKKTAEAINQFRPVPLQFEDDLMEINGGVWENTPWKELPKRYPQQAKYWNMEPWKFHPDQGEAMTHLYDRVYQCFFRIAERHPGETVFVVSHGCAVRNLLCRLKYNDIYRLNDVPWCDNTALSIIHFDEALQPTLVLENDASHLDAETSTLRNQVWCQPGVKEADVWA